MMVNAAMGRLPEARSPVIRQSMVWVRACTATPTVFVQAANSRSVPTAVAACTPKSRISSGVISEPPPTPVRPTSAPTQKPERL